MDWTQAIIIILPIYITMLFLIGEMRQISKNIATESKDFHGRLCRLEERYLELKQKERR